MAYVGERGWRREPTRGESGNVQGGHRVALVDFKKAKKQFYHTLKLDKETFRIIKIYNQVKGTW